MLSGRIGIFFFNPAFFLLSHLPPRISNTGEDPALQKEERPPFRLRGNSKQFYPELEDLDELVFFSLSPLFSEKFFLKK